MPFSGILFDMDGVVIDTLHSVHVFWEELAQKHQVELTPTIYSQHIYGIPAMHTLTHVFPHLSADDHQAVLADIVVYENQLAFTAMNGVVDFIRSLKQYRIKAALVTMALPHKVRSVFDQLDLNDLFSAVVTAADVKKGKPDPQCYLLGAQHLGISPQECIVFEDAIAGVKAGVAAGATCIGIQQAANEAALLEVGARYVVPDFTFIHFEADGDNLNLRIGENSLPFGHD